MEDISFGVILAQIINFGIIVFVFYYFLGNKIIKLIEDRRQKILDLKQADDIKRQKLNDAEKEANKILDETKKKVNEMQKNNEILLEKQMNEKMKEAELKADFIIDSAKKDMEKEREIMLRGIKKKIVDTSLMINGKFFDEPSKNKEFIKKEVI
ncbi:ATP synthase F0 subunit B [Candidatus Vampirococcus lugosii]|uniref:ATP synthase subunit b n=1 Tax=Candidatus Vampirococcus lugosii TaxID=2789015 RepID=A0ABS5QLX6_9BACT|nr:ATP synthase F0 subunit B [Candidatus Vampirococcus lugosii]MBS8121778.1 FoF1-type ATP synthase, membrane subunit b or b' [Candidatus Vampirococcus lugosii]